MGTLRNFGILSMLVLFVLAPSVGAQDFGELKKQLISGDREARREAALSLRDLGESALPALPELIEALADDDEQVAGRAVMAIAAIGPNAPDAIPALIEHLDPQRRRYDEQVVFRMAFALGKIGDAAVDPLREALGSSRDRRRLGAAHALALIGADAAPAIPELIVALRDDEEEVRQAAGEALAAIGKPALASLAIVLQAKPSVAVVRAIGFHGEVAADFSSQLLALEVDDDALSAAVVTALGAIGFPLGKLQGRLRGALLDESEKVHSAAANVMLSSDESLPVLKEWLSDDSEQLRQRAAWVVGEFGAEAAELAPELIAQLKRGDEGETIIKALSGLGAEATGSILDAISEVPIDELLDRDESHWSITVLKSAGPLAIPKLDIALASESAAIRLVALDSLAGFGKVTRSLEPKFRKATSDPEPAVRRVALIALEASGADTERLVNILHRRCVDESGDVRAVAVRLLGGFGNEDREAFKLIEQALADPEANVRAAAIGALANFGSEGQSAIPKLLKLAASSDAEIQLPILKALAAIGSGADEALPFVQKSLDDSNSMVRGAAIDALVAIDPDAEHLTGILSKMLSDKDKAVRHPAIEGLGKRGESAASAAPQLFKLLENEGDRMVALEALRQIGSKDVDLYIEALESKEPRVRLFACEALGRLGKDAGKAVPALEKAKRDRYDFVRRRAEDAIKRIQE